jgi:hypothetical protein
VGSGSSVVLTIAASAWFGLLYAAMLLTVSPFAPAAGSATEPNVE